MWTLFEIYSDSDVSHTKGYILYGMGPIQQLNVNPKYTGGGTKKIVGLVKERKKRKIGFSYWSKKAPYLYGQYKISITRTNAKQTASIIP